MQRDGTDRGPGTWEGRGPSAADDCQARVAGRRRRCYYCLPVVYGASPRTVGLGGCRGGVLPDHKSGSHAPGLRLLSTTCVLGASCLFLRRRPSVPRRRSGEDTCQGKIKFQSLSVTTTLTGLPRPYRRHQETLAHQEMSERDLVRGSKVASELSDGHVGVEKIKALDCRLCGGGDPQHLGLPAARLPSHPRPGPC